MPFGLKTPGHLLDACQQNICRWDIKANLKKIRALIEMMSSQKLKESAKPHSGSGSHEAIDKFILSSKFSKDGKSFNRRKSVKKNPLGAKEVSQPGPHSLQPKADEPVLLYLAVFRVRGLKVQWYLRCHNFSLSFLRNPNYF